MPNLGNAWHIPANPEPRDHAGMREPVFPTQPLTSITIISGNQFAGGGNPGNQLQDGSAVFFKLTSTATWTSVPTAFASAVGNNKYYTASLPVDGLRLGDVIEYYLRIPYDDHATTFLHLGGDGATSTASAEESSAQAAPFTFIVESPAVRGTWSDVFDLPNVGIHASLLHTGEVLLWGRRDSPEQSLDTDPPSPLQPNTPPAPPAACTPFVWNPSTRQARPAPKPTLGDAASTNANLFCSGHAFLPDGRLLVVGGHRADSIGLDQSTIFDPDAGTWTPGPRMKHGRWYPTALSLPDGRVLVLSGSYSDPQQQPHIVNNNGPEIWTDGGWVELNGLPADATLDLYPRVHVASNGLVFQTGTQQQTWSFDSADGGTWSRVTMRESAQRDYAPSVMYDVDKIVYIGGGNFPIANAEKIDLSLPAQAWSSAGAMQFPRRQHNATILADGTVLVTGGTRGGGAAGTSQSFNDLDPGQPVHIAELWEPDTGQWTQLAAETIDRCYHATAVLLPDATVLSAGGGEFFPTGTRTQNDPADSHRNAQVFSPPYLFKGQRPQITSAPDSIAYGESFVVATPRPDEIAKASLVRLSSVTHSFNANQRIAFLAIRMQAGGLTVTAPPSAAICPPGHYMLFIVDTNGVPSVASMLRLTAPAAAIPAVASSAAATPLVSPASPAADERSHPDAFAQRDAVRGAARGTEVVVGVTGTCPYGIAACWGGAHEALRRLEGVELVDPVPDGDASTATVFMHGYRLPSLDVWRQEFERIVDASYALRGVEVTVSGTLERREGALLLSGGNDRPALPLSPLVAADKVQWDRLAHSAEPMEPEEADAYDRLAADAADGFDHKVTITGPLLQTEAGYRLEVRGYEA
jgi:galactose oxidase